MSTAAHLRRIETIRRERLPFDYYWVDAGWYGPPTADCANLGGDWSRHTGNWVVNPVPHPRGLRPVSDAAHAAGLKFLLWVETERAVAGTPVTREHPEWFLHAGGDARQAPDGDNLLLNLGHPEARGWALDLLSTLIHDIGMDGYRQDFNMEPLPCWQAADAADRQGLTEIRHIEGLYAFWDELLRRHPGLVIDNCASGGRRIDLETISRSVPLWRSDFQCFPGFDPTASQVHTSGLSRWVPLSATGTYVYPNDTYDARSGMAAGLVAIPFMYETDPLDPQYPWEWLRQRLREHQRIRPFHDGDFYPLTECTTSPESWMAYQLHRPDLDAGVLAVFRRPQSPYDAAHWPLRALEPGAAYAVEDQDSGRVARRDGSDLMATGVEVALPEPRSSRLIFYRRAAR
jgi:alpha-galactosidase